jgi:hypothetical protein
MIGHEEFARFQAQCCTMESADEVLAAWGIDMEAFAIMVDQFAHMQAAQVEPIGPLAPYQALYTMFLSGFEMGYLSRLEAELQQA